MVEVGYILITADAGFLRRTKGQYYPKSLVGEYFRVLEGQKESWDTFDTTSLYPTQDITFSLSTMRT